MPQYSFSSIASLATSQRKEPAASSESNNSYNSGFQQYQPPPLQQPPHQQQQHIQNQQQNHLPHHFAAHHQAQPQHAHLQQPQPQQLQHGQQPVHQPILGDPVPTAVRPLSAIPPPKHSPHQPYLPQPQNVESTAQQKPTTTTFQPLATSTTTTKSTIDFVKPPVNEHDIDPPAAASAAANDEKEVVKEEDDKAEVKHKIVTQQPQIHPGKVPPIVISTRKPPTISLPKQEQLEEENEEDDNSEDKDNIKQEKIKDAMEIDIIEKNDGRRDVNTMTGHALNQRTMLDGMILTETSGGLLVVNVMYKNKEFFGTLMECASSSHTWGAPRHSDIPPPDKKPKKKKKSKSENRLAPRIGLRNRRRMKRRNKRDKRLSSWDTNNSPPKSNKRISF